MMTKKCLQVEALFEEHSKYLTEPRLLEAAREAIQSNMRWMSANTEAVCKWLDQQD